MAAQMTPSTRAALYARFSTDLQSVASIDDQLRDCRSLAQRQGWNVVAEFSDAATSGASLFRSGVQAMLRDAAAGRFEVVVAESLDRLSRDQEDTAGVYKRLTFAGVRIVTPSEGDITLLHVGLKGTMSALFLKELAEKTRRGLRGRVEAGKSGGGLGFGYRIVTRGEFEIVREEADVIADIFKPYAAGQSPKTIAMVLNAAGIAEPGGGVWSPSTIHGHAERGTGILNNELYIGRRVWGRLRYLKDPDTGRRVSRVNPRAAWVVSDVSHLRIIDDALWLSAKQRQTATRQIAQQGLVRARRPIYVFSGMTICGTCGGGFTLSSRRTLRCFNASSRGTCANQRTITRQELEGRVLRAIQERFFAPGVFQAFCNAYVDETNRIRREHLGGHSPRDTFHRDGDTRFEGHEHRAIHGARGVAELLPSWS